MTPETQRLIDRLEKSARNVVNATNPAQREAAQTFLVRRADELRAERDRIAAKLTRQFDWLDAADPGVPYRAGAHDETFLRREGQAIATLHDYEAIEDALSGALATWLGGEAA